MSHTKEPWKFGNVRGDVASLIRPNSGQEMVDIYPAEDARRIVACVNACAGSTNDDLTHYASIGGVENIMGSLETRAVEAEQHRDELLALLKGILLVADRQTIEFDAARAAIAKATEGKQ